MPKNIGRFFLIMSSIILIISMILWIFFVPPKEPIKIGLMVTLTGSSPELGRAIRDGAFFAVEEINKGGGIGGRKLSLIIKDNQSNDDIGKRNYIEFLKEGVYAVIGPATSTRARAILPLIDSHKLLVISPTVSSTEFSSRDDFFITLEPNNRKFAETLGMFIKKKIKPKRLILTVDDRNPVYVRDFSENLVSQLDKTTMVKTLHIRETNPDFDNLAKATIKFNPDFVILITDVFNAAILTQKIKQIRPEMRIAISPWARFRGYIEYTGHFSNGVLSVGYYDESSRNKKFMEFSKNFQKRFGYFPDSAVIQGYNSVLLIKEALLKGANRDNLRSYTLNSSFTGVLDDVKINRYGDAELETFVVIKRDEFFEKVSDESKI